MLYQSIRSVRDASVPKCARLGFMALALGLFTLACGGGGGGESTVPATKSTPVTPVSPNSPPNSPVALNGKLTVNKGQVVNETGTAASLRGMSFYWSNWASTWWNVSAVDQAIDFLGCQIVRAPLSVDNNDGPVIGGYLDSPDANRVLVETVVNRAIERGVYVIIDWHDSHAESHKAAARQFFLAEALKYKNVPNVIFEIYNEPLTTDWKGTIRPYAQDIIDTIRQTGAGNLILVGTGMWSQQVDVAVANPVNDANVAYVMHFYAGQAAHAGLRNVVDQVMAKNFAVFVSEWGTSDSDGNGGYDEASATTFLQWMKDKGISWCNWELFDKNETCGMFKPGTNPVGPWATSDLTTDGVFVKSWLPTPAATSLSVTPSLLPFDHLGGDATATVITTGAWSATSSDTSWLTCTDSGSGNGTITVTAQTNNAMNRTGTIFVKGTGDTTFTISVTQQGNNSNLALGKMVDASSWEGNYLPSLAVDGDKGSRWAGQFSFPDPNTTATAADPSYLAVDLGAVYDIGLVILYWEAAYSADYDIQVSDVGGTNDGDWTTIYTHPLPIDSTLKVHTDTIPILSGRGRYIRMYSRSRIIPYGPSLYEFEVYEKNRDVYVSGVELNDVSTYGGGNTYVATVWKNGVPTGLSDRNHDASAASVAVSDQGDVYVVGSQHLGGNYLAGTTPYDGIRIWKNGSIANDQFPVPADPDGPAGDIRTGSGAGSVVISGGVVYVGGGEIVDTTTGFIWPTIWTSNGDVIRLTDGSIEASAAANGMVVSGSKVYVAGTAYPSGTTATATLWTVDLANNNQVVTTWLTSGSVDASAWSVAVSDANDIYVAGYVRDEEPWVDGNPPAHTWTYGIPTIWKQVNNGGVETSPLTDASSDAAVFALAAHGGHIYGAGYEAATLGSYFAATIWTDSSPSPITDAFSDAQARSLFFFGDELYATGFQKPTASSAYNAVVLWWNGNATPLTDGTRDAMASSVFVTNP